MKKRVYIILVAFVCLFVLMIFIESPEFTTGLTVADQVTSFFVRNSLSSLGPLTVLSLIFAVAVVGVYELRKK